MILAVAVALALQTTAGRFVVRGTVAVDLVLVVVVYVALTSGPATGLLSGTFAGLVQDALSSSVIGIGGLAKTIVGFLAGIIGTQFIVAAAAAAVRRLFRATVLHAVVFMGLYVLLDLRHFGAPVRPSPGRRPRTPWSAWWRFSWSSCCRERWSAAEPKTRLDGFGDGKIMAWLVEDRRKITIRLTILQYDIAVFSVLAVSFWVLQVVQHAKFEEMAENNHQRTLALRAPRGIVFDRNLHVLVENRQSYSISIVREHTKDLNRTVRLLATVLGIDEAGVRQIVDRHRREPTYRPITIVQDATLAQVAAIRARRLDFELPDVVVEPVPTRRYPDAFAAHLFGYVGEVNDRDVSDGDGLKSGDIVGQSGIEKVYNALLMGEDGARRVVVNSVGREIRTLDEDAPNEGKRVALTVDYDLQKALEDGFKASGFNGASVIMDPRTGEVLAFTSVPAYDPNAFAAGIDRAAWASLNTDDLKPLQDRAIQGRYSPGSTFKMAVATAALEEGVIKPDFTVYCPGHATFFGRSFQCSLPNGRGHGTLDLRQAIERSCNVYFYTVGNMVGIDKIHKWATLLGLGEKSGIDLPNEPRVLCRRPSGNASGSTRSGTPARRSRCRSARARSR